MDFLSFEKLGTSFRNHRIHMPDISEIPILQGDEKLRFGLEDRGS